MKKSRGSNPDGVVKARGPGISLFGVATSVPDRARNRDTASTNGSGKRTMDTSAPIPQSRAAEAEATNAAPSIQQAKQQGAMQDDALVASLLTVAQPTVQLPSQGGLPDPSDPCASTTERLPMQPSSCAPQPAVVVTQVSVTADTPSKLEESPTAASIAAASKAAVTQDCTGKPFTEGCRVEYFEDPSWVGSVVGFDQLGKPRIKWASGGFQGKTMSQAGKFLRVVTEPAE
mmetsp:Transcript_4279/g.7281  ORF Transcript_4279/g.7281 Transcript_4279/m.7281 type:complete len:231 (-) Transcript_4279:10-702(-)